ncbi:AraC family transcriptional regulator [Polyangium aurulentum]|uniref:AraC family transcriptional regulator n=1 Tax=Polyangium aurulentum TaxID=2567896 RepID=UPI00146D0745|nr:AraC family transcriptional regulator [Polyangium aurulentum]UQA63079.1 AraC family transcriptional regulator [Polyangium aurulentum]
MATYFVRPLRRVLASLGRDPASVLEPFGLSDSRAAPRIPFETAAAVWSAAEAALDDPAVGLRAARMLVSGDYGALEFAARSSPTLRAAFERLARYHRLLNDRTEVILHGRRVRYVRPGMEASMPAPYLEFVLATWARIASDLADHFLPLERVLLPHAPPSDDALHREVFGCEVRFGAGEAELQFAEGALDAPLARGDGVLASTLDRHAEAILEEIARGAQWTSQVMVRIERRLTDGTPRLEDIARDLDVPPRMLRRRLQGEGTTFARVVDDVRRRLALKMTADPSLSLGEIAFLLGFSEPSAFHRAFRRWTGRTPRSEEPSTS